MTVAYKLDMLIGDATNWTGNPLVLDSHMYVGFARFIRLCASAGLCTVVASNYGAGPSPEGDGENYYDPPGAGGGGPGAGAAAVGENAWIYSEWNHGTHIMGVLIQWANVDAFGASPGNPGEIQGSTGNGVAWAMAVREDGASPWNGSGSDNGAATKGDPVWTAGATHVFPMSNNPGYANATSRENMARVFSTGALGDRQRCHLAANENTILLTVHKPYLNGAFDQYALGRYRPAEDLALADGGKISTPYFMLNDDEIGGWFAIGTSNVYGDEAGTGATQQGGILADPAQGVLPAVCSYGPSQAFIDGAQPNNFDSKIRNDMCPMMLFSVLNNRPDQRGFVGWADSEIIANAFVVPPGITNDLADRAFMGSYTRPAVLHAFPWDGGPPPGTLKDREGRETII